MGSEYCKNLPTVMGTQRCKARPCTNAMWGFVVVVVVVVVFESACKPLLFMFFLLSAVTVRYA